MNLADLSIKRPTFITCVIVLMLALGWLSFKKLGVDLFPNVTFPVVVVNLPYPGAGPSEVETLVTKPLEDEIATLAGIKRLTSNSQESLAQVIAEFSLETDVKYAEQQIRDRVSSAKRKFPTDVKEPIIRRVDPADQPVVMLSVSSDTDVAGLYDLANEQVKTRLEQVNQVGLVEILGGRKREIHVKLDRDKLKRHELSASMVASRIQAAGENIPAGKIDKGAQETNFRTLGQFSSIKDIGDTVVNFFASDVPVTLKDVASIEDSLVDEASRTYVNGKQSLLIYVFRQSGANTIGVVEAVKKRVEKLNEELKQIPGNGKVEMVRDGSVWIRANVDDVKESIIIGVLLAVVVVYFFLASGRSTIITGLALPNSLIGAFILMAMAGFSVNVMTLLALSLSVGLLVDDAIVVRENIFRHIEMGKTPIRAAIEGTAEVRLAVIAVTLTVLAVFGPIAFLKGVVGQFFREFGATICFAMIISLFDALTIAPMLSAYFAGKHAGIPDKGFWGKTMGSALRAFEKFQQSLENRYESLLKVTVRRPGMALISAFLVFLASCSSVVFVPKTFLPAQDQGEFSVGLDLPPGTSLSTMDETARKVDELIRSKPEVEVTALTTGGRDGSANTAEIYVKLVPSKKRKMNTIVFKEYLRNELKPFAAALPKVKDFDPIGAGQRPFNINFIGNDQKVLEDYVMNTVLPKLKEIKGLKDADTNYRPGKPEFQVVPDKRKAEALGVSVAQIGMELRTMVEGVTPAKFRQNGIEYDVRVRLKDDQRNLKTTFETANVPNINYNLVRLANVAEGREATGPAKITRQDRGRYIGIGADITGGLGDIMAEISNRIEKGDMKMPPGVRYAFVGQAENFSELAESVVLAMGLGVLFIFLVLSSLYESFVTPFTIMLALPLAICGSFVALAITQQSMNIFSMIGMIMLLGVAVKNSILLVDYAQQLVKDGMDRSEAMIAAGKTRLRPILMTTMALIAGTIPIALGLNEASRQRTSMGVAIIGGLISSTLLTLLVVPAAYSYIDRFRVWSKSLMGRIFGTYTPTLAERAALEGRDFDETPRKASAKTKSTTIETHANS
jgi:HAE1 family hydrophobic/amphiphilic exporter-1